MRYELKTTDKLKTIRISDRDLNSTTDLRFLGQGYTDSYEQIFAENSLHRLENFYDTVPPSKSLKGQLWVKSKPDGTFDDILYCNSSVLDGVNTSDISKWVPFVTDLKTAALDHITKLGVNDPHRPTKQQIGLGLVDNVLVYNKDLNLSDILSLPDVQTNLDFYDKSVTYTRAEYDSLFLPLTGKAADTDLLQNIDITGFVVKATPKVTSNFEITGTQTKTFSVLNNEFSIDRETNLTGMSVLTNVSNGLITVGNSSAVKMELISYQQNGEISLSLFNTGSAGSTASLSKAFSINKDNVFIDGNSGLYHFGRIPTNAEIGSLPVNGKAANSALLQDFPMSYTYLPNSIVARSVGNGIYSSTFAATKPEITTGTIANYGIRRFGSEKIEFATPATIQAWLDIGSASGTDTVKHHGSINGVTGSLLNNYRIGSVSKIGTGIIRVTLSSPAPSLAYAVVMGSIESTSIQPSNISSGIETTFVQGYVNYISSSTFDIYIKRYQVYGSGNIGYVASEYFDIPYIPFTVHY